MFMANYKNSFHVCPTVKTNKPLIFKPLNQSKNKINIKFKTKSQNNPSPTIKALHNSQLIPFPQHMGQLTCDQ